MPAAKREHTAKRAVKISGIVYCPMCTHTVDAKVMYSPKVTLVVPGQKCQRCASSLDAGYVFGIEHAA